jgi:hypothetical protein
MPLLPLAKDIDDFDFDGATVNEILVRDLAGGGFVPQQRNVVLVGGTATGKTHLAIAIARSYIRAGLRGRFFKRLISRRRACPGCAIPASSAAIGALAFLPSKMGS